MFYLLFKAFTAADYMSLDKVILEVGLTGYWRDIMLMTSSRRRIFRSVWWLQWHQWVITLLTILWLTSRQHDQHLKTNSLIWWKMNIHFTNWGVLWNRAIWIYTLPIGEYHETGLFGSHKNFSTAIAQPQVTKMMKLCQLYLYDIIGHI